MPFIKIPRRVNYFAIRDINYCLNLPRLNLLGFHDVTGALRLKTFNERKA